MQQKTHPNLLQLVGNHTPLLLVRLCFQSLYIPFSLGNGLFKCIVLDSVSIWLQLPRSTLTSPSCQSVRSSSSSLSFALRTAFIILA